MMTLTDLASLPSDPPVPFTNQLRLAVAACLTRLQGILPRARQEELDASVLEPGLRDQISQHRGTSVWLDLESERILPAAARVGQDLFARQVLANCGCRCVFCGLRPSSFGAFRMLLAGHFKPWKDSSPAERLDPRNGLAASPATASPSTPACSWSTADCASTSPVRSRTPSGPIHWPGSTTEDHRCAR